jgi:hypothetical protein
MTRCKSTTTIGNGMSVRCRLNRGHDKHHVNGFHRWDIVENEIESTNTSDMESA